MAFDQNLADRIRVYLGAHPRSTEKKMFGGLTFLLDGKMTVGIMKNNLMVRVLSEKETALLENDGVEAMQFTGKTMKEFVEVLPSAFKEDKELYKWIELGIEHAEHKLKTKK